MKREQKQINFKTKVAYTGNNAERLELVKSLSGFKSHQWITFLQAKGFGFKIKKGAKGVKILKFIEDNDPLSRKDFKVRGYTVFNLDQVEKITK